MKRMLGLIVAVMLAVGLTGCAGSATSSQSETSSTAGGYTAKTWAAITPGPNESKRIASLSSLLKLWTTNEKKAGHTPVDLTGITPKLVGYRVQIWAKQSNGKFTLGAFEVTGGRVDQLGDYQVPLVAKNVALLKDQPSHPSEGITPTSAGEKDAIAKALAWAKDQYPGYTWNADIQGYQLYYALKTGYFLFIPNATTTGYMAIGGSASK
jgi:hypothetical protein